MISERICQEISKQEGREYCEAGSCYLEEGDIIRKGNQRMLVRQYEISKREINWRKKSELEFQGKKNEREAKERNLKGNMVDVDS